MLIEWTGQLDRQHAAYQRRMLWSAWLSFGVLVPFMFFSILLFIESVQAHGLWKAIEDVLFRAFDHPGL